MSKALVILSGGQDSTTCLGLTLERYEDVSCITFDYAQRHRREIRAAADVVNYFSNKLRRPIPHETIMLPIGTLAGSSPITDVQATLEQYASHADMERIIGTRIEKTFVPMRNALFLMIAANRAEVMGARQIVIGVCEADNANYPDCRQSFLDHAEWCIDEALGHEKIVIDAPLINMTKAESVHLAAKTPHTYGALAFSHTAYDGSFPPTGADHATVLRAHGFEQAGLPDPLILRAYHLSQQCKVPPVELPSTPNYDLAIVQKIISQHASDW